VEGGDASLGSQSQSRAGRKKLECLNNTGIKKKKAKNNEFGLWERRN